MYDLARAELMDRICPTEATYDCCQGECSSNCENCEDVLNYFLDRYDEELRADERAKMLMPYDVESIDDLIENVRTKALDEIEKNIDSWWNEIQGDESDDDKNWYSSLKMLLEELRK